MTPAAWPGWADMSAARDAAAARLPGELRPLAEIAMNYRWSWLPDGEAVFEALDAHRWALCGKNPLRLLEEAAGDRIRAACADGAYIEKINRVADELRHDLSRPLAAGWNPGRPIVYLCAEFGVHCSLPVYAGGLGVLAGDVLKECSDRAIPTVGIGLLYRQGYLHQRIDGGGHQLEYWTSTDPERLPAALVSTSGQPLLVEVPVAGRNVVVQVWRIDVGRVPLYLLDTERAENSPLDRWISGRNGTTWR